MLCVTLFCGVASAGTVHTRVSTVKCYVEFCQTVSDTVLSCLVSVVRVRELCLHRSINEIAVNVRAFINIGRRTSLC